MGARILIVEDEEPLALLLRYNLESEGYEVETLVRGDEADTRLREAGDAGAPIVLAEPDSPAAQALEKIADDARAMRDLLERQLQETDRIADASRVMLDIAQKNDAIAREFNATVQNLVRSGQEFESEVTRFRFKGADA